MTIWIQLMDSKCAISHSQHAQQDVTIQNCKKGEGVYKERDLSTDETYAPKKEIEMFFRYL